MYAGQSMNCLACFFCVKNGGFVSSRGWLRHRPGGVGLRPERPGITGATGPSMSWGPWPRPVARAAVGMQECTQIGENGLSAQPPPACRMRPS